MMVGWGAWISMWPLLPLHLLQQAQALAPSPRSSRRCRLGSKAGSPGLGLKHLEGHLPAARCVLPHPSLPDVLPTHEPLIIWASPVVPPSGVRSPQQPGRAGPHCGRSPCPQAPRHPTSFGEGPRLGDWSHCTSRAPMWASPLQILTLASSPQRPEGGDAGVRHPTHYQRKSQSRCLFRPLADVLLSSHFVSS